MYNKYKYFTKIGELFLIGLGISIVHIGFKFIRSLKKGGKI